MSNLIEQIADEIAHINYQVSKHKRFSEQTGSNSLYILVAYFISYQKSQGDDRQYTQSNSPHVTMKDYGTQQGKKKRN
jgi:hypothetical protein